MIKLNAIWRKTVTELLVRSNTKPTKHRWVSPLSTLKEIQVESIYTNGFTAMDNRIIYRISRIMDRRPYAMLYELYNTRAAVATKPARRVSTWKDVLSRDVRFASYDSELGRVDDWLSPTKPAKPAKPKSLAQDRQAALIKVLEK